jgi:hypothetical protein
MVYNNPTRSILIKFTLLFFVIISSSVSFCQNDWNIIKDANSLPIANNRATVKGFPFDKSLYISKDSLKKGFLVSLKDPLYKIHFFRLVYECEDCDIWVKTIYGDSVTPKEANILNGLKKGDILSFVLFKVERNRKFFTIPDVNIIITD